jgi:uncharacterized protein (TIGR04255 family)
MDNLDRNSISSESLKRVIIRFDIAGVSNIDSWISEIKPKFCSKLFKTYTVGEHGEATFNMNDFIRDVSESGVARPTDIVRHAVHVFSSSKFDGLKDNVHLEITQCSIVLVIDCCEYISIDPYLSFISDLLLDLLNSDFYIELKRIGIRKYDCFQFNNWDDVEKNLSTNVIGTLSEKIGGAFFDRNNLDRWSWAEYNCKVNFNRRVRKVESINGAPVYQIILDIDTYISDDLQLQHNDIFDKKFLSERCRKLNDASFELFASSLTPLYVASHGKFGNK